jgi:hypothetical protein
MARKTLRNKKDEAKLRKLITTFTIAKNASDAANAKMQELVEAMPEAQEAKTLQEETQLANNALVGACCFAFSLDPRTKFVVAVDENDKVYVEVHDGAS